MKMLNDWRNSGHVGRDSGLFVGNGCGRRNELLSDEMLPNTSERSAASEIQRQSSGIALF